MPRLPQLLEKIETLNRRERLFKKDDSLLLAVSGGADSIALLALFCKLRRKYKLSLAVAHLDHGLSAVGARHRDFVQKLCRKWGIPCHIRSIRVARLAKKYRRSVEETGRIERYAFFTAVAKKIGSGKIATAHTLDDQAETVLLRLLRGSGIKGMAGIPPIRNEKGVEIIRPLFLIQKSELRTFLKENRIPFRFDKTNRSDVFTRNRVRRKLIPLLEKEFNPQIKESLFDLAAVSRETHDYLDRNADRAFRRIFRKKKDRGILLLSKLRQLHPALRSQLILKALTTQKGNAKRFGQSHVAAILNLLDFTKDNLSVHVPGNITVTKRKNFLEFCIRSRCLLEKPRSQTSRTLAAVMPST